MNTEEENKDNEEFGGFDEDDEISGETCKEEDHEETIAEMCQKLEKYDIQYSKADKINLIKKIEMYLEDPELRKLVKDKIHLAPYIDLGSMKKKRNFNELDGRTLNWIYDELRDVSLNNALTDMAFKGYLSVNNVIETIAVSSGYVPELKGYSENLDTGMNRILMKQITIDSFDYFSGRISPQYMLMFNTLNTMSSTYKVNKIAKTKEEEKAEKPKEEIKQTKQPEEIRGNTVEEEDDKIEIQLSPEERERQEKIKAFCNQSKQELEKLKS